jgi:DNA-directed RNA polymerase subunit H
VTKFAVKDHDLVPEHILLTPEEGDEVLKRFGIEAPQLPKIHVRPRAKEIGAKLGI